MHLGKEKANDVAEKPTVTSLANDKMSLNCTNRDAELYRWQISEQLMWHCLAADRAKEGGRLLGTVLPKRVEDRSANSQYLFIYLYLSVHISPSSWRLLDSEDIDLLTHPEKRLGYRLDGHPIHVWEVSCSLEVTRRSVWTAHHVHPEMRLDVIMLTSELSVKGRETGHLREILSSFHSRMCEFSASWEQLTDTESLYVQALSEVHYVLQSSEKSSETSVMISSI